MTTTAPRLSVRGLAKSFGPEPVFEHASFELRAGEFVALLGESGVGKSTLLNVIAGLEPASAGTWSVDGQALPLHDERALAQSSDSAMALWRRAHLGFVFQAFHVLPHLSVAQNIALPLLLLGRPDDARVQSMLDAVGLAGLGDRAPRTLSGGQLQRVAIARALVHAPPLVLADEPTGNLDAATAERVIELLASRVHAQGAACLIATHSAAAATRADRVLRLTARGVEPA